MMDRLAIRLTNVKFSYKNDEVISINNLTAYCNEKIAIVGRNGSGKSTLLNLIVGNIMPNAGNIQKKLKLVHIPQIEHCQSSLNIDELDFKLMSLFNIPDINMNYLSGGEKQKLLLTDCLSINTEGILLDEPTSHMDSQGIRLLTNKLKNFYGLVIFVSHDRKFINDLATKVWEIEDGKVSVYSGNYDDYIYQKEALIESNKNTNSKIQKEKEKLLKSLEDKKRKAESIEKISTRQKKRNIKPNRLAASKQKDTVQKNIYKNAKNIQKRLDNIGENIKIKEAPIIEFPSVKYLEMHNRYPIMGENIELIIKGKLIFKQLNFQFEKNERIAIIGDNGSGKTSLLNYILNENQGVIISKKAKINVYKQMDNISKENTSIIKFLEEVSDYNTDIIKSVLLNLGFSPNDINIKTLNELSGGEATKLGIAKLLLEPSNVLLLDEPTNFLDIYTINALEELLKRYKGTIIFTSHDQSFIKHVATQIWEIKNFTLYKL